MEKMTAEEFLAFAESGRKDFTEVNLDDVDIVGERVKPRLIFDRAVMRRSRWRRINLTGSSFQHTNLESATITGLTVGVDLYSANCQTAVFNGLTLEDSCLVNADFRRAQIFGTDFSEALVSFINLKGTNLAFVKGLTNVQYGVLGVEQARLLGKSQAPALVDETTVAETLRWYQRIATLRLADEGAYEKISGIIAPMDEVAEFFSRNGVDYTWVRTFRSEAGRPPDKPVSSVFVSYSFSDTEFAMTLNKRLRNAGVATWMASEDIEGGSTIIEQIRKNITKHDRLLLILSARSIESRWVCTELREAARLEIETGKKVIYPIRLTGMQELQGWRLFDSDLGIDIAQRVREFYIPDFSRWTNPNTFETLVGKLVGTLRVDSSPS